MMRSALGVVLHVDIDAFYVAAECVRNPELVGKRVAVSQFNNGGFVAVSTAAKAAGIKKGDGIGAAGCAALDFYRDRPDATMDAVMRRCPDLLVLPMDTTLYRDVSLRILRCIRSMMPAEAVVEKASIDDFYVSLPASTLTAHSFVADGLKARVCLFCTGAPRESTGCVSELAGVWRAAAFMACALQAHLARELPGVTASIGVAPNRLLAKLVGAWWRPCGVSVLLPDQVANLIAITPLRSVPGLKAGGGLELAQALAKALSIPVDTVMLPHVAAVPKTVVTECLGESLGAWAIAAASGEDATPVQEYSLPASILCERSFNPLRTADELSHWLQTLAGQLLQRLHTEAAENSRIATRLAVTWRVMYGSVTTRNTNMPRAVTQSIREAAFPRTSSSTEASTQQERAVSALSSSGDALLRQYITSPPVHAGLTRLALSATHFQPLQGGLDGFIRKSEPHGADAPASPSLASSPARTVTAAAHTYGKASARKRPRTVADMLRVQCGAPRLVGDADPPVDLTED